MPDPVAPTACPAAQPGAPSAGDASAGNAPAGDAWAIVIAERARHQSRQRTGTEAFWRYYLAGAVRLPGLDPPLRTTGPANH